MTTSGAACRAWPPPYGIVCEITVPPISVPRPAVRVAVTQRLPGRRRLSGNTLPASAGTSIIREADFPLAFWMSKRVLGRPRRPFVTLWLPKCRYPGSAGLDSRTPPVTDGEADATE